MEIRTIPTHTARSKNRTSRKSRKRRTQFFVRSVRFFESAGVGIRKIGHLGNLGNVGHAISEISEASEVSDFSHDKKIHSKNRTIRTHRTPRTTNFRDFRGVRRVRIFVYRHLQFRKIGRLGKKFNLLKPMLLKEKLGHHHENYGFLRKKQNTFQQTPFTDA